MVYLSWNKGTGFGSRRMLCFVAFGKNQEWNADNDKGAV